MEAILEVLLEIFGEFLIQVVVEMLAELGVRAAGGPLSRPRSPWLAALGYAALGSMAGGLSLLAYPNHLVQTQTMRLTNLVLTPIAAGIMMTLLGMWRTRRGQDTVRIDRFFFGYLFALGMALVRYLYAT